MNWFSPSITSVLETELRSLDLMTSALTYKKSSLAYPSLDILPDRDAGHRAVALIMRTATFLGVEEM